MVCEVLENAVDATRENDLELTVTGAVAGDVETAVKKLFKEAFTDPLNDGKEKIELGDNLSLSEVNPDQLVVHSDNVTYLLKRKEALSFFAEILRNTKASAAELRAYPQYVNPKAYEKLRAAKYPLSLPFDLFAEEVRAAFRKTNLQRWDLMRTLRSTAAPNNPTDGEIAAEYLGISTDATAAFDEKRLILMADATIPGQQSVWGEAEAGWLNTVGNAKTFLQKTSLEYNELLALLELKFINPTGDIGVHHLDPSCDTDQKVIQVLDESKLDRIHRFLRLWRKLKDWKMWELDLVIGNPAHPGIGNGALDEPFLVNLFYFCQLRKRLGGKTTVEQVCALFGNLNTETRFTKLHEKREDALYQSLFLNKRLINPLDLTFAIDPATNEIRPFIDPVTGLPKRHKLVDHHPVTLAALGIREGDLVLLEKLTKASDGITPYITDDLTLGNLSFLWRHAWLSKLLKLKTEEWKTILKVFQQDILHFATPEAAWKFVERIDHLKAAGFTPDELNWLLAADRSAKAATKETDAARFLAALRKGLQAIQAEFDPGQYDFLTVRPPTDLDGLTALLTSLLQKLNRDEAATQFFIATLRDEISQEKTVAVLPAGFTFPVAITGAPNSIPIRYEPVLRFSGSMTAAQRMILLTDPSLAAVTGLPAYQQAIQELFQQPGQTTVTGLPTGFTFAVTITGVPNNIPIRYEPVLRFNGVMTAAQRTTLLTDPSLAGVTGIAAYQEAIAGFFLSPRLALKFFEPVFTAPLANLPTAVDFKSLPDAALALKSSYDAEQHLLRFEGILSKDEKVALDALSADVAYRNAVNSLLTQPVIGVFPPEKLWLLDPDLQFPLRDLNVPANDHLADNLTTAATKALAYLSKTLSENATIQQSSAQLGLTEPLTRYLLSHYALLPDMLLKYLTVTFAATGGVVQYDPLNVVLKNTFDGWFWANKAATILNKWKITLAELEKITALTAGAQLLDLLSLPLDATHAIASIDRFIRTSRLLRMRDSLSETDITLLEVLEKLERERLTVGTYLTNAFAADMQRLNEFWPATDVEALTASLDLAYPADYLLAESWERLRRAFYFLDNLNAGAVTATDFAAAAMGDVHAKRIKELLRSKFGTETWLILSAEIQDALRERKRDALAAFLLTQPPADAPSGKWENTNDLYAYYLLDVEMSSCQLTSRLVQGSGSIQLFVQRCFMGLEPDVVAQADGETGDSAWRWWKWMRKYRVWEANRKVFLWPENWIEPELKKDKSPFFKDMENELLQNEINQYTAETAFSNYLEKLDGVAQLEIAGFYQEDDGDNAIVHVFGRTAGAEPHLYYYRRYDYRQWSPWEKVELDIQGDYLIPAVVNKRLFLFWPVFTEVPDEAGNRRVKVPRPGDTRFTPDKTTKNLRLQMAESDYRQGKWTPKKVSRDSNESESYTAEIVRQHYRFLFIDRSNVDGRFGIQYDGYSVGSAAAAKKIMEDLIKTARDAAADETEAAAAKTAADIVLQNAQAAFAAVRVTANHAKTLLSVVNDMPPTCEDTLKTAGAVERIADAARIGFGVVDISAVTAQLLVDRTNDNNFRNDVITFRQVLHSLDLAIREVKVQTHANAGKPIVCPLTRIAQARAKDTVDAGEEAVRTATAFKDDAARTARTAGDELIKTTAAREEAENARDNFKPDNAEHARFLPGAFEISGCTGLPEKADPLGSFTLAIQPENASTGNDTEFLKWVELPSRDDSSENDFTLVVRYVFGHPYARQVLRKSPGIFKMSPSWHLSYFDTFNGTLGTFLPFFYNDKQHTFFVLPSIQPGFGGAAGKVRDYYPDIKKAAREYPMKDLVNFLNIAQKFHFKNFYHPFVCHFAKLVYNPLKGIPALMSRETQLQHTVFNFEQEYDPDNNYAVVKLPPQYPLLPDCYPREVVDFTPDGAYSPYNWELFFHAPLLIANSLMKNQRFEEAQEWYHFIFNPIGLESPVPGGRPMSKYWITKPFFETTDPQYVQQRIDNIMRMLAGDTSLPGFSTQAKKDLEDQVFDWRTNPFEPHRIANYRTVAYQKTVVMKYLDNLIAWGDNLFRQDSMESINEATQLYVLAAEMLGPRPKRIPHQATPAVESFNELEKQFDDFSNALVQVENFVPVPPGIYTHVPDRTPLPMLYFCIPQNDKMLGYWDTVADRLYKIRHCMNIEGVVRQLALFEPPIDPAALVKAAAAGVDISSTLADLNAPLPLYRFNVLLQKANEVCNDVKALGGALLAALEKKDAEAMGLLRQSQEIRVLEAVKAVKEKQIEEARENLEGTQKSKVIAETRRDYYRDIEKIALGEQLSLDKQETALGHQGKAQQYNITASVLGYIPNITIGVSGAGGSPHVNAQLGTGNIISALQAAAGVETLLSNAASFEAGRASTLAGYDRRFEDWKLQERLADKELDQIAKQIAAAELRIAIAEKELENHALQIENAKATDAFMRSKYTNEELYQWQVGQISGVYFQSYKLAYDLAKRAERCFRFELGLQDSSYISFGYWDSLKKGLLSGEKLQYDLRRLETAYQEQNRREYELTKHLSLALLDPLALVKLRETGRCFLRLPEENFDLDYPGHYFRRIKSVSITLPCVTGPYTSVSCTLRLLKNYIRINTALTDDYAHAQDEGGVWTEDSRFVESNIPVKAIAASNAQNDSGVFELSFRDERYLPFEGAGAVSEWSLELFSDLPANNPDPTHPDFGKPLRQFDYGTITDAVIHVKYTAKEDAGPFKNAAIKHLREYFEQDGAVPSLRLFNLRQEFPTQWHRFLNPANPANGKNIFELEMSQSVFRMLDEGKTLKVNTMWLLARCTDTGNYSVVMTPPLPAPPPAGSNSMTLARVNQYGGLHFSQKDVAALEIKVVPTDPPVKWQLQMARPGGGNLQEDPVKKVMEVEDLLLVLGYEWD